MHSPWISQVSWSRKVIIGFDRTHTIYVVFQSHGLYDVPRVLIADARSFQALDAILDWLTDWHTLPRCLAGIDPMPGKMNWDCLKLLYCEFKKYEALLHITCGYQCDKAVNKNDTREVIWCHFTEWNDILSLLGFELSNQIDCNNLAGPIGFHVIFWILADAWRQIWREELLCSLLTLSCTSTWWLDFFFKHVICNKQIITCQEPDIVFIYSFLIPYRSLAQRLARSRYGIKTRE